MNISVIPEHSSPKQDIEIALDQVRYNDGWMSLLASTARLLDVHDSSATLKSTPSEERLGGDRTGARMSAAFSLLGYLQRKEEQGESDFIDITPFIESAILIYGIEKSDVESILLTLSTPTELRYAIFKTDEPFKPALSQNRETALIDKHRRGTNCRLSKAGRATISMIGYFKWAHAAVEAQKLITDIKDNEIKSFHNQGTKLLMRIRQEAIELRKTIERPNIEDRRKSFSNESDRYIKTIAELTDVITELKALLRKPEVIAAIEGQFDPDDNESFSFASVNKMASDLNNAVARLHRLFHEFIEQTAKKDFSAIGVLPFDQAAALFLMSPPNGNANIDFLHAIHAAIGPIAPITSAFSPIEIAKSIVVPKPKPKVVAPTRVHGVYTPPTNAFTNFLTKNFDVIAQILAIRPITLTEVLTSDLFEREDLECLVQAATLISSPLIIHAEGKRGIAHTPGATIELAVGPNTIWRLDDNWEHSGPEITMTVKNWPPKPRTQT